ncbi:glycosyltransferase family 61 protein [Methylocystis parvus]|uniref:glycosyltransferase family 61 protein n=1 Tax=Methylocystis parvus TaxID=134 RepID=UPI003C75ABE7
MRVSVFRGLFRRPQAAATVDAEKLALRIHERVCAVASAFSPEEEAVGAAETVSASRACLALNLLRLRAMGDPAALAALGAYMRIAFGAEDYAHLAAALDSELWRRNAAVSGSGGAELVRKVDAAIDADALFHAIEAVLDEALGVTETPTQATFDEDAYLAANPDVAAAVARGEAASGRAHWRKHGAAEGRVQRRLRPRDHASRSVIFPLRFVRDAASNAPVGDVGAEPSASYILAPLSQEETHDATPSLAEERSIGRQSAAFAELQEKRIWTAPPLYVAAFDDACADLRNGALIFDRDKAWGDSFYATILSPGGNARAPEFFSLGGRYAWLRDDAAIETISYDAPLMLCTTWASRINYGHWLMNTLFSVYLALDDLRAGRLMLLCPSLEGRQREEILALGAPPGAIAETNARFVRAERLLYPSPLSTYANMRPPARAVEFLDFVRQRFARPATHAPRYVFLSRIGFPSARRMTNEAALCDALARIGFHVARTHEMSLGEQIALMSNAKVAIGQFGAALWNTPFMPQGAQVVEIATSNYVSNEYLYISHLTGHRLSRVMVEASTSQGRAYDGDHFDFEAPIGEIVALARALM